MAQPAITEPAATIVDRINALYFTGHFQANAFEPGAV
jgi:hypothetical protein